jgi:hypothetical protein
MAVERRLQTYPGIRADAPQIRSIESAVSADFDSALRGVITGLNRPLLMRGFKINIPPSNIPANTLTIQVSDSAILHSSAAESGTILTVPAGTPDDVLSPSSANVIGAFQNGAINYVALQYVREIDPATADQTAGWSQSQKLEFQRTVPIGRILQYQYVITTTGFGTNLPLYIVGVSAAGTVDYITKAVTGLFRLGSGGTVPNPQYTFNYSNLINPQTGDRREWVNTSTVVSNPMSVVPGNPANAFDFGDWSIGSLKDWMDAVMSRLREITGSAYWYLSSPTTNPTNIFDIWFDSAGSVMTGAGNLTYNYILEATAKTSGAWATSFTDPSISTGDSYVVGFTSGRKGTLANFNNNDLIVNSLTGTGFIVGELLLNRRTSALNYSTFQLTNFADAVNSYGFLSRVPGSVAPTTAISSWSYDNASDFMQVVTIVAPGHTLNPGDLVNVVGLTGDTNAPNGIQWVRTSDQGAGTFTIKSTKLLTTGSPTVGAATVALATTTRDAYYPTIPFTSWSYSGTNVTLSGFAQAVPYTGPVVQSCTTNGTRTLLVADSTKLFVGQLVVGTNIGPNTVISGIIDSTHVTLSNSATGSGTNALNFFDQIVVSGTTAASNAPNGTWAVQNITPQGDVQITVTTPPTGTAGVTTPLVWPDYYQFLVTVTNAVPAIYNTADVTAIANGPASFWYPIGPSTVPPQPAASGNIIFDGVVAIATVADPVMVSQVQYSAGDLIVTTATPHNLSPTLSGTVTIYGDPNVTGYAQTYQNVQITVGGPNQFTIIPTGTSIPATLPNLGTYVNGGTDQVFLAFPGNPFPGPVAWDSDIVIKGIIGDKAFIIPQSATATGDPLANKYNTGGVTGTAYIQDRQAMYVILERNQSVSSGATFNCSNPSSIVGTAFLDIHGNPLAAGEYGDFVKFSDEDESKWVRIGSYSGPSQINLVADNGQPPTPTQRPNRIGQLVYCKSTYHQVVVEPHYLVSPTTDVFWLAVRRDNGGLISKVYFRALELQAGESRQINDSTPNGLLIYTGAGNEAATVPNYSTADTSGAWQFTQPLTVTKVYDNTRVVTFQLPPVLGFQKGDKFTKVVGSTIYSFTITYVLSGVSVQVEQDVSVLSNSDVVTYYQNDYAILDQDNLTLAIRKEDREQARVNTVLDRIVYDESAYIQQINFSGFGTVQSGRYIYTGPIDNPTGLAWVMHGTAPVTETIDNQVVTMPGGHPSVGPNACLVHIISGAASFTNGMAVNQIDMTNNSSVSTGRTINNPGNPPFDAPPIVGASGSGVQLVLPPNRRTQVYSGGGGYSIWPTDSYYKATTVDALAGEDLLVIANDSIRQAQIDYEEVFSGPKGIIRIVRSLPANTRMRFRSLATYGSALIAQSNGVTLQIAYNNGQVINALAGVPVQVNAGDAASGGAAIAIAGSLVINGDDGLGNIVGIIKGTADKKFSIGSESNKPLESWAALLAVKTHINSPGSAMYRSTADVTTTSTGATTVTDSAISVPDNTVIKVQASGVAREISNNGQAAFVCEGSFYMSGGVLTMMGSPITTILGTDGNGSTYAMTMAVVANQVMLVAYGDSTATYWAFAIDYQMIGSAS